MSEREIKKPDSFTDKELFVSNLYAAIVDIHVGHGEQAERYLGHVFDIIQESPTPKKRQ